MVNKLTSRYRRCFEFPASYGRFFGEGSYVLSHSNHRWPKGGTMHDAVELNKNMQFAEAEARAIEVRKATGKHILTMGPHGLIQIVVQPIRPSAT